MWLALSGNIGRTCLFFGPRPGQNFLRLPRALAVKVLAKLSRFWPMSNMRRGIGMISGVSAIQASNIATPSSEARSISKGPPAAATNTAGNDQDTVQLSSTGQQHLAASQAQSASATETVSQVLASASEGNIAALSLLVVI
jgi:hypothetical protein